VTSRLRERVSFRIGLAAAGLVLLFAVGQGAIVRTTLSLFEEEALLRRAGPNLALALALLDSGGDAAALRRALGSHEGFCLALYDREGHRIAQTRDDVGGVPRRLPSGSRAAADARPSEVHPIAPVRFGSPVAAVVSRPGSDERYLGYFDTGLEQTRSEVRSRVVAASFGLLLLMALLVTWGLTRTIRRRVVATSEVVRRIAAGALDERLPETGDDELGQLARSFNRMVAHAEQLVRSLRDGEDRRRRLFAAISHELNTPLTSVLGYVETVLLDEDLPAATRRRYLEVAAEQARALDGLARDLETLSRADLEGLALCREATDLAEVVRREVDALRLRADAKSVRLRVSGATGTALLDPMRMAQVVRNVLDNALRHAPAGSAVDVELDALPEEVRVRVIDRGAGIPAEHLAHVGEPLFRVDPSRARRTGGRGLGLAVARTLTDAHGGRLSITSTVGSGTTAQISVPRAER
jgi:signal transduction histidine kinase